MNNNTSHSNGTNSIKPARLIRADGTEQIINPLDGKYFTFPELYPVLDCTMIEFVVLPNGNVMLLDEDAKVTGKPRNAAATAIATNLIPGDFIAGDVVVCDGTQLERDRSNPEEGEFTLLRAAEALVADCIDKDAILSHEPTDWMGDVATCGLCRQPLTSCNLFVDGTASGAWFLMCALCFLNHGDGPGYGRGGQLYARQTNGTWRMVAGFLGQAVAKPRISGLASPPPQDLSKTPENETNAGLEETIAHYTLTTGHLRISPRHEVSEKIIRLLDPLVAKGWGFVPAGDGRTAISFNVIPALEFSESAAQDWVGIEICVLESGNSKPSRPVIVGALAWSEEAAQTAYESLRHMAEEQGLPADAAMPSEMPLLVVMLTSEAFVVQPKLLEVIGDFERCLAWTILAQEGLAS